MNKKLIFGLMALMMVVGMVAAQCPPPATPTVEPTKPVAPPTAAPTTAAPPPTVPPVPTKLPTVTLFLWHGWDPAERGVLNQLVTSYIKKYPNIILQVLYTPFDQLKNKFQTAAATGGGPHILIGPHDWLGDFVAADLVQPLDTLAPTDLVKQMNPVSIAADTYKGKLYALPESNKCVALFYNKALLGDKQPPKTTDEMLAMAKDVAPKDGYGLGWDKSFYMSFGYFGAFGAKLFDDSYKCILDQGTGTVDFLTFMKTMKDTKGVTMEGDMGALFKQGKIAMTNGGIWALGDFEKALGADKVGVVPLPAAKNPAAPYMTVESIYISKRATPDEAKAAMAFIAHVLAPEQGKLFVEQAGRVPANTAVDISAKPNVAAFALQSKAAIPQPSVPEMGAVWGPAGDMINKVLEGKLSPADAVAEAVKLINTANKK
jgi:maltose-binding protein MalE